jgi:CRISPR-associated protein Csy1
MTCNHDECRQAVLTFFETKIKKSKLFKAKDKVSNKEKELSKPVSEKNKLKLEESLSDLIAKYQEQVKDSLKNEIPEFITEASEKANELDKKGLLKNVPTFKVTHPTKFTSGEIQAGGIYFKPEIEPFEGYLSTGSLKSSYYDLSHQNGALITYTRFLMINLDGQTIYDKLENSDIAWLLSFTLDKKQAEEWLEGLKIWAQKVELKDAYGLKQIYFPVGNDSYHTLAPLFSSSLYQSVHENVIFSKFSDENKHARNAKKDKKYIFDIVVEYPRLAITKFGGAQPQNITGGNFERQGKAFLFPCNPPVWKSTLNPPIKSESLFENEFDYRVRQQVKELKEYLKSVSKQESNSKIRSRVTSLVNQIIGTLFSYVVEIQNLAEHKGWSEKASLLPEHHKLWLDPFREDESFLLSRKNSEWASDICRDFGLWLNKKLETKTVVFTKYESDHWALMLEPQLKEFERDLEASQ